MIEQRNEADTPPLFQRNRKSFPIAFLCLNAAVAANGTGTAMIAGKQPNILLNLDSASIMNRIFQCTIDLGRHSIRHRPSLGQRSSIKHLNRRGVSTPARFHPSQIIEPTCRLDCKAHRNDDMSFVQRRVRHIEFVSSALDRHRGRRC